MDGAEEEWEAERREGTGEGGQGHSAAPPLTASMKEKSQQNAAVCTVRPSVFAWAQRASGHRELLCSRSDMVNKSGALSRLFSVHFHDSDIS